MKKRMGNRLSQVQIIALGFFCIIAAGTLLLMLPWASKSGNTSFIDALFTAVSASCVVGLVPVDTYSHWSIFGQLTILTLIQIGGLGFMSIGVFFSIYLRRKINLKERALLQESISTLKLAGIVRLTKLIIKGTIIIEGLGAVLLSIAFVPRYGIIKGIYFGVFHSITAFCNAGFDLMGCDEAYSSLTAYVEDPLVNITVILLILIGGLGFIVWQDILENGLAFRKYLLHTKVVIIASLVLVFGGALLFYLFEADALFADLSPSGKVFAALFSAVTPRTAGFNTVDTGLLSPASRILTSIFMLIGGCSGSTAGGIKVTTVVVLGLFVLSNLRNEPCVIFERRIPTELINKACLVLVINLILTAIACMVISAADPFISLDNIVFEVMSAIGTVGMTCGITRDLSLISRIVIIILMYCGRLGSMSFALTFTNRKSTNVVGYPEGKITVG